MLAISKRVATNFEEHNKPGVKFDWFLYEENVFGAVVGDRFENGVTYIVVVVSDRHTSSVSPYRYPESRDEQKPGPERRDCEAFVIPPKGLMQ